MKAIGLAVAMLLAAAIGVPSVAMAQGPKVAQVIVAEVEGKDQAAYLAKLKEVQAIVARLGTPGFRVWQATLAGPNTGSMVIVVEHPDAQAWASNSAKVQADAEWQKWLRSMQESGLSQVVSSSMMVEVTP